MIGQNSGNWERMPTKSGVLGTQKIMLDKALTFRFGNDETLKTRTMAELFVGIDGVNGVLRGGSPLLFVARILERPLLPR